jgi:hypothetical protein
MVSLLVVGCTVQPGLATPDRPATLMPTKMLSPTFTPEPTRALPTMEEGNTVEFTVVYDNSSRKGVRWLLSQHEGQAYEIEVHRELTQLDRHLAA